MAFRFRPLERADFSLMHRWLGQPHVAEWWGPAPSLAEVEEEYGEYVDGVEPIRAYIVYEGDDAIGHVQFMRYRDYAWYARILGIEELDAVNCDVFIGDERRLHRGLGAPLLRAFVEDVIFADTSVTRCFIDPDARNAIAIRAYEKVGFRFVRHVDDDGEGSPVHLMERVR
ncbi:MAG TPA: GNAT family N-acetyltransferase [Polyangiaceae bacterium]